MRRSPPTVPPLPLADALGFADPGKEELLSLGQRPDNWTQAVVLAPGFWKSSPPEKAYTLGKLIKSIELSTKIPALAAASIGFDPERDVHIGSSAPGKLSRADKSLLASLRSARVEHSAALPAILKLMSGLTAVSIRGCSGGEHLSALGSLASTLQTLRLFGSYSLTDLSALTSLQSLRALHIEQGNHLREVTALASLTSLETLEIDRCEHVSGVAFLRPLASLKTLALTGWKKVSNISPLVSLTR